MADSLIDALLGAQTHYTQTNPLYVGGAHLLANPIQLQTNDPIKAGIASALSNIVGGAMAGYGQKQAQQQYSSEFLPAVQEYASNPSALLEKGSQFQPIATALLQNQLSSGLTEQQAKMENRQKAGLELIKTGMPSYVRLGAKMMGVGEEDLQSLQRPNPIMVNSYGAGNLSKPNNSFVQTTSVLDKVMNTAQVLKQRSPQLTDNAAYDAAQKLHASELAALKEADPKAKKARTDADQMMSVATQAEMYIKNAGDTGGFGGWFPTAQKYGSGALGLISEDQRKKFEATQQLDTLRADILKAARPPGSGPMTDKDAEFYLSSSATSSQEPETNEAVIRKLKNLASYQYDYADFNDWYRLSQGTMDRSEAYWNMYKKAHPPILVNDKANTAVWNENRPSWQEFFGLKSTKGLAGPGGGVQQKQQPQIRPIGQTERPPMPKGAPSHTEWSEELQSYAYHDKLRNVIVPVPSGGP